MKKLIMLAVLLGFSGIAQARDSMDGCGLGWEVTEDETLIATTTRGTTNNFVPPSFGMTTGTLGCKQLAFAANDREAVNYVASNYSLLKKEIAAGRGEYVDGLVEVMSCGSAEKIQKNYNSKIAPAKDGVELYKNLKQICG